MRRRNSTTAIATEKVDDMKSRKGPPLSGSDQSLLAVAGMARDYVKQFIVGADLRHALGYAFAGGAAYALADGWFARGLLVIAALKLGAVIGGLIDAWLRDRRREDPQGRP